MRRVRPPSAQTVSQSANDLARDYVPGAGHASTGDVEPARVLALVACLSLVAAVTLSPQGTGWSYGAPLDELRWYADALPAPSTALQLLGNLGLLSVPTALVVRLQPVLRRPWVLACVGLAAGVTIETLQWLLPLGRVVSPLDAALNAIGAVTAGWLVVQCDRRLG